MARGMCYMGHEKPVCAVNFNDVTELRFILGDWDEYVLGFGEPTWQVMILYDSLEKGVEKIVKRQVEDKGDKEFVMITFLTLAAS